MKAINLYFPRSDMSDELTEPMRGVPCYNSFSCSGTDISTLPSPTSFVSIADLLLNLAI